MLIRISLHRLLLDVSSPVRDGRTDLEILRVFLAKSNNILLESKSYSENCSVISHSLWPHGLYSPWNSPGKKTEVGSLSLLQGIFPTQGLNPHLFYQLNYKGSPRILEWVAFPFSSWSSWPRNRTGVSCITDRFFIAELSGKPLSTIQNSLFLFQFEWRWWESPRYSWPITVLNV